MTDNPAAGVFQLKRKEEKRGKTRERNRFLMLRRASIKDNKRVTVSIMCHAVFIMENILAFFYFM